MIIFFKKREASGDPAAVAVPSVECGGLLLIFFFSWKKNGKTEEFRMKSQRMEDKDETWGESEGTKKWNGIATGLWRGGSGGDIPPLHCKGAPKVWKRR